MGHDLNITLDFMFANAFSMVTNRVGFVGKLFGVRTIAVYCCYMKYKWLAWLLAKLLCQVSIMLNSLAEW